MRNFYNAYLRRYPDRSIIYREENGLELFQEELMLVKNIFNDAVEQQELGSIPNDIDVAHIISHGQPIWNIHSIIHSMQL